MIENVLIKNNIKLSVRISIKAVISVLLIALAVGLPQLVHAVGGAEAGMQWLPMYLPVLLAGCTLGKWWGLGIGIISPLISYGITALIGSPMPALARLPFMTAELAVFALVAGLFANKIVENKLIAFPAVLIASVVGRAVFMALVAIFDSVSSLSVEVVWSQVQAGFIGLIAQAVIVPAVVMLLCTILEKGNRD